jgi:hypothetical protein
MFDYWIKSYVSFPIDGWSVLFTESQPSAETLFEWLSSSEVKRLSDTGDMTNDATRNSANNMCR